MGPSADRLGFLLSHAQVRGGAEFGRVDEAVGGSTKMDDGERLVDLSDDRDGWDGQLLPQSTRDDTDAGWGEPRYDNDARLLAERPPHWDAPVGD